MFNFSGYIFNFVVLVKTQEREKAEEAQEEKGQEEEEKEVFG